MRKQNENYPIDIVIFWVDGSDPEWLAQKSKFSTDKLDIDDSVHRYRDWDNLQYIFRGIEKFVPWVNHIYFVTWGHLPKWLNVNEPKLTIIKHGDYIPAEYNPTFSSHTKGLNLHRIAGLSEHFILFSDDMFIIKKVKREDFFKNRKPCDSAILTAHSHIEGDPYPFVHYRTTGILNKHFKIKEVISKNRKGWYNLKYGKMLFRSWVLSGFPYFTGIWQQHLPFNLCKSTFEELWEKEYENLHQTCLNKFRSRMDFNIWVFRNWQFAKGNFYPRSIKIGKSFYLDRENAFNETLKYIEKRKGKLICINDHEMSMAEFDKTKHAINAALDNVLPEKSKFEL